jgi:hypothetical protein
VICAEDWDELARLLEPVLSTRQRSLTG